MPELPDVTLIPDLPGVGWFVPQDSGGGREKYSGSQQTDDGYVTVRGGTRLAYHHFRNLSHLEDDPHDEYGEYDDED